MKSNSRIKWKFPPNGTLIEMKSKGSTPRFGLVIGRGKDRKSAPYVKVLENGVRIWVPLQEISTNVEEN